MQKLIVCNRFKTHIHYITELNINVLNQGHFATIAKVFYAVTRALLGDYLIVLCGWALFGVLIV